MNPLPTLLLAALLLSALPSPARADALGDARKLSQSGQTAQALATIDQALAARPRDAELRFERGVLLSDLGRRDEAIALFRSLNDEQPELPDPLNNLAVLLAARGELEAARTAREGAQRNNTAHRAARENLGDVYLALAIRQWQMLASDAQPDATLRRKLSLARELAATMATKRP